MPAAGIAAVSALQVIGRSEYEIRPFHVKVLGFERGHGGGCGSPIFVHSSIFAYPFRRFRRLQLGS